MLRTNNKQALAVYLTADDCQRAFEQMNKDFHNEMEGKVVLTKASDALPQATTATPAAASGAENKEEKKEAAADVEADSEAAKKPKRTKAKKRQKTSTGEPVKFAKPKPERAPAITPTFNAFDLLADG